MKRTLSVPSLKSLFLTRMLGGSVGGAVALYVLFQFHGVNREVLVVIGAVIILILSILIAKDWRTWSRLKQVAVDDHFLYVSDYADSNEIVIPLSDIVRVTQWRGRTLRPVTISLRSPARFGMQIQFQPKIEEWGFAWNEDKIVQELRTLANLPTERLK